MNFEIECGAAHTRRSRARQRAGHNYFTTVGLDVASKVSESAAYRHRVIDDEVLAAGSNRTIKLWLYGKAIVRVTAAMEGDAGLHDPGLHVEPQTIRQKQGVSHRNLVSARPLLRVDRHDLWFARTKNLGLRLPSRCHHVESLGCLALSRAKVVDAR